MCFNCFRCRIWLASVPILKFTIEMEASVLCIPYQWGNTNLTLSKMVSTVTCQLTSWQLEDPQHNLLGLNFLAWIGLVFPTRSYFHVHIHCYCHVTTKRCAYDTQLPFTSVFKEVWGHLQECDFNKTFGCNILSRISSSVSVQGGIVSTFGNGVFVFEESGGGARLALVMLSLIACSWNLRRSWKETASSELSSPSSSSSSLDC